MSRDLLSCMPRNHIFWRSRLIVAVSGDAEMRSFGTQDAALSLYDSHDEYVRFGSREFAFQ